MRTRTLVLLSAALAATLTGMSARADSDDVGKWYLNPMIQGVWLDDDRSADDHWGGQIGIGKALSEDWNIELNYARSSHNGALGNDLKLDHVELDVLRVFYRDTARANPYFLGGLGWLQKNYDVTDNTSELAASLGAGLLVHLASNARGSHTTSLRGEFKVRYDNEQWQQHQRRLHRRRRPAVRVGQAAARQIAGAGCPAAACGLGR